MAKYHVNPATGEASACRATINCRYAVPFPLHGASKAEALKNHENFMDILAMEPVVRPSAIATTPVPVYVFSKNKEGVTILLNREDHDTAVRELRLEENAQQYLAKKPLFLRVFHEKKVRYINDYSLKFWQILHHEQASGTRHPYTVAEHRLRNSFPQDDEPWSEWDLLFLVAFMSPLLFFGRKRVSEEDKAAQAHVMELLNAPTSLSEDN